MDIEEIKRSLRAEIKKRENEQYLTFQCNIRQMCKDVLAKLEEQEALIKEMEDAASDIGLKWAILYSKSEDGWESPHKGKWLSVGEQINKLEEQKYLIEEMKEAAADIGFKWHEYDAGEDAWEDTHKGKWVKAESK